ncbi:MAG: DUF2093 domain-containing protein [OCS116 cluster bacterium]|uniref:DUF2093 domain-containing protein n=1 Tax=OCS116 cluster bacterium TaxID=2030921 RepID=A0A2A4Z2G5_9PROT|nr:DUF2093 domain-containing protein [OCS116 cluster bacterium]
MFGLSDQKCAKLHYNTPDYIIVEPGDHVLCAVTNKQILLGELKYWNVERQEAYVDGAAMMQRELEFKKA